MNGHFNLGDLDARVYFFGTASLLGTLFAFISTDDDSLGFALQWCVWQLQTLVPMALIVICHQSLNALYARYSVTQWWALSVSGFLGALLFSPIALALDIVIIGEPWPDSLWLEWLDEMLAVAPPVLLTWLAINAPWVLGYRLTSMPEVQATASDIDVTDAVKATTDETATKEVIQPLSFLNQQSVHELMYLEAELHYLKVVTTIGEDLVLYNLKDAVIALPDDLGMQCHRSFWVSRRFVVRFVKHGRQGKLVLTNGEEVPVSRSNTPAIQVWLAQQRPG